MPREEIVSLNEREFIARALTEGIRIDGRTFDAYRDLQLEFGEDTGTVNLKLGKTRIIVTVSCEVTVPFPDRKFDGIFKITTELSPAASPVFEVGRPNELEIVLSRILEKAVRRSGALDTESLCIVAGAKCFTVSAAIHVLDYDGSLVDASSIALVTALCHYRRPDVSIMGEKVKIYSIRDREPVPLSLLHRPFCITLSLFKTSEALLVDATQAEERVRDAEVIVTVNTHGEALQVVKYGGMPVDALKLLGCFALAKEKVKVLAAFVQARLDEDAKKRTPIGLMAELRAENER